MSEAHDPLMLSTLQHYSYCPRQCALIHVVQAFDENVHTLRGQAVHERVDEPGFEEKLGVRVERALPVWSERLGLIGPSRSRRHGGQAVFFRIAGVAANAERR